MSPAGRSCFDYMATPCKGSRPARRPRKTNVKMAVQSAGPSIEIIFGAKGHTVQGLTPSAEPLGQNVKTAVRRAEPSIEVMLEAKGHTVQGLTPRAEASEDTCKDDGVKG